MTPEDLVPTRETSERLKAAGFPQETYFGWADKAGKLRLWDPTEWSDYTNGSEGEWIAAPTLGEILEQLRKGWHRADVETWNSVLGPHCCVSVDDLARTVEVRGVNPAEAAALLWLRVNGKEKE